MDIRETPEVESVEQLARRVFAELHQAITLNESGAMGGSVESIHDMRVAVRRLRVALGNFAVCVSKSDRKTLRSQLENLANALGKVRDLDVMISTIKPSLLARSNLEKSAGAPLIRRMRARRRFRLRALRAYLRGEEYAEFKRSFLSAEERPESSQAEVVVVPAEARAIGAPGEEHGQAA